MTIHPFPYLHNRPLRVALFSGNYNCVRDGANRALNRLVDHLTSRYGIQVRVYSPTVACPAFEPAGDLVSVASIPAPGRPEYRIAGPLSRSLMDDVRSFAPDIIHLSAPDILGWSAQRFARRMQIPVVASLHTRFETYLSYYRLQLLQPLATNLLRRFYEGCDRILVPTFSICDEMLADGLGSKTGVWARGVDRESFSPDHRDEAWRASLGFRHGDIVPLFFGRLVREKGLHIFADVIDQLKAVGIPLRPLIVGEGPDRSGLEARLPDAVFTGHLNGLALGRAVASADLLINPSLTEAFGNVTLEALASGVPVICPDVGSTRDLVDDNITGRLLNHPKASDYVSAIAQLIERPGVLARMGRDAQLASEYHSWDQANDAVVRAYHDVYRRHHALPPRDHEIDRLSA